MRCTHGDQIYAFAKRRCLGYLAPLIPCTRPRLPVTVLQYYITSPLIHAHALPFTPYLLYLTFSIIPVTRIISFFSFTPILSYTHILLYIPFIYTSITSFPLHLPLIILSFFAILTNPSTFYLSTNKSTHQPTNQQQTGLRSSHGKFPHQSLPFQGFSGGCQSVVQSGPPLVRSFCTVGTAGEPGIPPPSPLVDRLMLR